jgi:hypothetical protein
MASHHSHQHHAWQPDAVVAHVVRCQHTGQACSQLPGAAGAAYELQFARTVSTRACTVLLQVATARTPALECSNCSGHDRCHEVRREAAPLSKVLVLVDRHRGWGEMAGAGWMGGWTDSPAVASG